MITIGLIVASLVAIMFGAPALVGPARGARARRTAARTQQNAARQHQKQAALAEQQRIDRLWRADPDLAGLGEWLSYEYQMRKPLDQDVQEAKRLLGQREEQVRHHTAEHGGSEHVPGGHRILVLAGLALFLVVFSLGIALDYLIFRGLHPGSVLLPFGLACLAVFGITIGSILFLGIRRHRLLPDSVSPYIQRVFMVGGALLATAVAVYMTTIAPNRSAPAGELAINKALSHLHADQTAVPRASKQVIDLDNQAVAQARADLAHAEAVDRLSAGILAVLEIPLAEAAVLGGELLMLDVARRRRETARQAHQDATDALAQADARFSDALVGILISHGHDEDVVHQIRRRLGNLGAAWGGGGQRVLPAGLPPPAPPGGGGAPAGPPPPGTGASPAQPAMPRPAPVGTPGPAPAGMPAAAPAAPAAPIVHIDPAAAPAGPPTGSPNGAAPGTTAPLAQLPPDEQDQTA